jgi:transposase
VIFEPKKHQIFFYNKPVDMRKGHSSLAMLVTRETKFELMEGHLFLFISRNRKTLKGLFFDGTGLVMVHKKLESGRFMTFDACNASFEVDQDEFKIIFHGGHIPLSRSGERIRLQIA